MSRRASTIAVRRLLNFVPLFIWRMLRLDPHSRLMQARLVIFAGRTRRLSALKGMAGPQRGRHPACMQDGECLGADPLAGVAGRAPLRRAFHAEVVCARAHSMQK